MKEEFKDIEGFENLYQISNLGNVKSLNIRKGRILKPTKDKKGYLVVELCNTKECKRKVCKVHRLVAQAFIENPQNLPQVNHIDEVKTNNAASNLEWCTNEYNINYGTRTERSAKKRSKQVLCTETNVIYPSIKEAAIQTGINDSDICRCCTGKRKTAYGYTWKYV